MFWRNSNTRIANVTDGLSNTTRRRRALHRPLPNHLGRRSDGSKDAPRGWLPYPGQPPILLPPSAQNTGNGTAYDNADFDEALCLGHGNATHKPNSDNPVFDPDMYWSMHPGGCNFLFADGSVHFLKTGMNPGAYQYLMTRAGGEIISSDSY